MKVQDSNKTDARTLLLRELERRCQANPRYSLRAFAQALGITPSALSMVLSGQRGLSTKLAETISKKLSLNPTQSKAFVQASNRKKKYAEVQTGQFNDLALDKFAVISEWYHFAILSLLDVKDFQPNFQWIATRLGISTHQAQSAVERLERLKILDTSVKRWRQIGPPILIENEEATAATRGFQKQVLEKAMGSMENDPMELRDLSSMTIAINPKWIPLAREEIKKFRVYLMNLLEGKNDATEVYHLGMQIYPVSKNRGN